MTTTVIERPGTTKFMQLAHALNGRAISPLNALTRLPARSGTFSGLKPLSRNLSHLPLPRMTRATIDGMQIPIFAGMDTRMAVKSLKSLLDLDENKQLILETGHNRAKILKDDDVIDLALACALAIITLNVAS